MQTNVPRTAISLAILLPPALACALISIASGLRGPSLIAAALFALFFLFHWRSLMPYPRRLGLLTLILLVWWVSDGKANQASVSLLADSATYYACFIASLSLMQCLVRRQPKLAGLHQVLLAGHPKFIYPRYVLSSFAIGSILSFGVLNLICGSLDAHLKRLGIDEPSVREGRRGVLVATLRGFALVPLLAPTSVAVAILTRELTGLTWAGLLPYGAVAATVLMIVGWHSDNFRLMKLRQSDVAPDISGLGRLIAGCVFCIACMAALAFMTRLTATQAAMLLVPCGICMYLFFVERSPRNVYSELSETLAGVRNEIFIFACSALLGGLVGQLIPLDGVAVWLMEVTYGQFLVEIAGLFGIIVLALLGVAPIVSLSLLTALLVQLVDQGLPALGPAIALITGFSLAMLISPFGPSALLLARYAKVSPAEVALSWNGRFVLSALLPLLVLVLLV